MLKKSMLATAIWTLITGMAAAQSAAIHLPQTGDAQEQSASPQTRARGRAASGVYKARIVANWFDDNSRFWYHNDLRGGAREFVIVDATTGERKPAFDHERLAKALVEAGIGDAQADRLPLDDLVFDTAAQTFTFRAGNKHWRCNLESYALSEIEQPADDRASQQATNALQDIPRATRRTGAETELAFVNQTEGEVELFWLDTDGRRRSYGSLAAGAERAQHTYGGHVWLAVDAGGRTIAAFEAEEQPAAAVINDKGISLRPRAPRSGTPRSSNNDTSPDGRWRAEVRDHNVFLHSMLAKNGEEIQLTQDGTAENSYGQLEWAPDSCSLIAFRIESGERHEVYLIESSPAEGGRAVLHQRPYPLPGDKFTSYELHMFRLQDPAGPSDGGDADDSTTWTMLKPELEPVDFGRPRLRWSPDGERFRYVKIDRGHQRLQVIEVETRTASVRSIVDERTDTFIWTAHSESMGMPPVTWLEQTDEIIYASEVDGWRHLYLIDAAVNATDDSAASSQPQIVDGQKQLFAPGLKHQITKGQWVVRGVDRIDEAERQIWFRASGVYADQDPYLIHHCRVNFDGTGLVVLTAGNGDHAIQFSPDRRYIIDTYSRIDAAPVHELRRVEDGGMICKLEEADITELRESGWEPPEVFTAKGRDGVTDIWGIICRPRDFDPDQKYPVIEDIYAGPHSAYVPKSFSSQRRYESLTELGFIVVKIDGMGTAHRSKAFHDVCWHNLKDAGFPDRILWMKAAAARYPQLDLSRVGVYGGSAGGQNAAGAVLFHGDFYKVAVAGCGCHDNRMDKASWNEQWMGFPVGQQYAESSNIDNAHRLQGQLLLIVGEMDTNVPPESTMRLADALIKADKDFDLLVVPGAGHGMGGAYGQRRLRDFFVRHLLSEGSTGGTTSSAASSSTPVEQSTSDASTGAQETQESQRIANGALANSEVIPPVIAPPESFFSLVRERERDAARKFYKKYINVNGMPVVAAGEVADEALQRTYSIVTHMLAGRGDITQAMPAGKQLESRPDRYARTAPAVRSCGLRIGALYVSLESPAGLALCAPAETSQRDAAAGRPTDRSLLHPLHLGA